MSDGRRTAMVARALVLGAALGVAAACSASSVSGTVVASTAHTVVPAATVGPLGRPASPVTADPIPPSSRRELLHPAHKYFGVSVPGAPLSLAPIRAVARQVHKAPNLIEYFKDWGQPFDPAPPRAACAAGLLPVMTWESWSWADVAHGSPAESQPAYAPRRIAAGDYDTFLRASAKAVKTLGCPIVIRLDQEANGRWYPWGVDTAGMHNTAAQYVAMWRHVWTVFHQVGATNVIWAWSPNFLYRGGINTIRSLYPGNKYVDMVGIDGYVIAQPSEATVFNQTLSELSTFAGTKPWIIAETGVAAGPGQAKRITTLLHSVAVNPKLIGLVYLDQPAARANWSLNATAASERAFRRGIGVPAYGHAPLPGL
jgi:hypothetical protein